VCRGVCARVNSRLTCGGCRGEGHQVGAVLHDGLDGQLVVAQWRLLDDGDRGEGRGLGGLDDAPHGADGGGDDGGHGLHLHCSTQRGK